MSLNIALCGGRCHCIPAHRLCQSTTIQAALLCAVLLCSVLFCSYHAHLWFRYRQKEQVRHRVSTPVLLCVWRVRGQKILRSWESFCSAFNMSAECCTNIIKWEYVFLPITMGWVWICTGTRINCVSRIEVVSWTLGSSWICDFRTQDLYTVQTHRGVHRVYLEQDATVRPSSSPWDEAVTFPLLLLLLRVIQDPCNNPWWKGFRVTLRPWSPSVRPLWLTHVTARDIGDSAYWQY